MRVKCILFIEVVAVLLVFSCNKHRSLSTQPGMHQDCFKDRKEEMFIEDVQGVILMVADQYLIVSGDLRYQPCELPDTFKHQDMKVLFSGSVRRIKPEERWAGNPMHLTKIRQHISQ